MAEAQLLTVAEVAAALDLSERRVRQLIEDGTIVPAGRLGAAWAIPAPEVVLAAERLAARTETRGRPRRGGRAPEDPALDRTLPGFGRWLDRRREDPGPAGDLARLAVADPAWPRRAKRHEVYRRHLAESGAYADHFEALDAAWRACAARDLAAPVEPPAGLVVTVALDAEEAAALRDLSRRLRDAPYSEIVRSALREALGLGADGY